MGECRASIPLPFTTVHEDGTLTLHAMWPATPANEFCFEFVKKEEEVQKEKFSEDELIGWMSNNLVNDYMVDIYPSENNLKISGKIQTKWDTFYEPDKKYTMEYLEQFFAPEDIDVSFS